MTNRAFLSHPQAIRFPHNKPYVNDWEASGGWVRESPTGHRVFYGPHGKRILLTDPDGHPLHECAWEPRSDGEFFLAAARLRLDWGQWVGIKPEGLINTISLDLSKRAGWEHLTRDDLRHMAARSMGTDVETVRFFYRDDDLLLHASGQATIRQVKDAFYVLEDGTFGQARFMSCMSRLNWCRIDYLPVVELFLSLLPGTGSATFELIRGLYDDHYFEGAEPLRYRGIPVYPSEAAFRLFSLFFTPATPPGQNPLEVFLHSERSHEVQWMPAAEYPVRYFDENQRVGVTVRRHYIQKATLWDDTAGVSFNRIGESGRPVSDNRGATSTAEHVLLFDGADCRELRVQPSWQLSPPLAPAPWHPCDSTWKDCFPQGPPRLSPGQAFSSVLFYPDRPEIIGEKESQPFVFDFLDDFFEEQPDLFGKRSASPQVLFAQCEAGLGACLNFQFPQSTTLWYVWPEFAQKCAQTIWNRLFKMDRLAWLPNFHLLPFTPRLLEDHQGGYDWIYLWIPFGDYTDSAMIGRWGHFLSTHLAVGGIGCVAGPSSLRPNLECSGFQIIQMVHGEMLPTFRIHHTILPYGRLNPDLHVWVIRKYR